MFRGVRQVVPSGSQSLRGAMPSAFSMDEGFHWMILHCIFHMTYLTCHGSFSNCGNLSHPGQHPVSIGLASDQIINTLSLQPLNVAKGFDCKDSCGCLQLPHLPKGSTWINSGCGHRVSNGYRSFTMVSVNMFGVSTWQRSGFHSYCWNCLGLAGLPFRPAAVWCKR